MSTKKDGSGAHDAGADAKRVVGAAAEAASENPVVQTGARLGYAVSGVLHVLMGVLAVRLALGDPNAKPDQSGALSTLAGSPLGGVLLVLTAAGLALLGLWGLVQVGRRSPVGSRAKAGAKGVVYLVLAVAASSFLRGVGQSSVTQTRDTTALLMSAPLGTILVGLVGAAIVVVGGYHVVKGAQRRFMQDLVEKPVEPVIWLAIIGYVAKGLALAAVGVLFVQAAWTHDPRKSTGLDGALSGLLRWPGGPAIVGIIGLGFAAFGVYSFARARYART